MIAESPCRLPQTAARNVFRLRRIPYRWNLPPVFWCAGLIVGVGARWRGFDRAELAARLDCPLLVIHGALDVVSPIEDGRDIASAAPQGRIFELPDAGHLGLWTDERFAGACARELERFFERINTTTPGG